MSFGTLSRLRIVLAAVAGIIVALAAAAGIFLSLKVDPKTLQLADRIEAERVITYISSADRAVFFEGLGRYEALIEEGPTEQDVAPADRYEFALLRTGSGIAGWIVYGHNEEKGSHTTLVSENDPSLFLPLTERRRSLARNQLFQHLTNDQSSFAWFDVASLPLPESTAATLVRSLLSPYKEGLLIVDAAGKGRLLLKGKTGLRGGASDVRRHEEVPVTGVSLGDPLALIAAAKADLSATDPGLLEGLTGIINARLKERTGSTDLTLLTGLLAGPVTTEIHRGQNGRVRIAVAGTASEHDDFEAVLERAASVMTEGSVRRLEFLDEYSRSDVTAPETNGLTELGHFNGWMLKRLGSSGSEVALFAALNGRRYVLGNDEALVKRMTGLRGDEGSIGSGTMDMAWVSAEIETRLPFLQPVRPTLEALLGPSPSRLTWRASSISGGIGIDWTLNRAVAQ